LVNDPFHSKGGSAAFCALRRTTATARQKQLGTWLMEALWTETFPIRSMIGIRLQNNTTQANVIFQNGFVHRMPLLFINLGEQ
jgi:hypothetical protein